MLPLIFDSVVSVIVKDDVYFDNYKLFNIGFISPKHDSGVIVAEDIGVAVLKS